MLEYSSINSEAASLDSDQADDSDDSDDSDDYDDYDDSDDALSSFCISATVI